MYHTLHVTQCQKRITVVRIHLRLYRLDKLFGKIYVSLVVAPPHRQHFVGCRRHACLTRTILQLFGGNMVRQHIDVKHLIGTYPLKYRLRRGYPLETVAARLVVKRNPRKRRIILILFDAFLKPFVEFRLFGGRQRLPVRIFAETQRHVFLRYPVADKIFDARLRAHLQSLVHPLFTVPADDFGVTVNHRHAEFGQGPIMFGRNF